MKVAVDFSPRMRVERFSVAERRLSRSKTAIAVVHASLPGAWNRGLKSTATVGDRSAISLILKANWNHSSTPAGIVPCGGRPNAGSSIAMRSKNPGGQESGAALAHGFNSM